MRKRGYRIYVLVFVICSFLVVSSCGSDNFYGTTRTISTDKEIYRAGDSIKFTLIVSPLKEKKIIRVYDNYKNIELSFSIVNEKQNLYNHNWSPHTGASLRDTTIQTLEISKEKPFMLKIQGYVTESADSLFINLPKFAFRAAFLKAKLKAGGLIRIHGLCNPINPEPGASIEEFFEPKDIQVCIDDCEQKDPH